MVPKSWAAAFRFRSNSQNARGSEEDVVLALGKDRKAHLLDENDLGGIGGQLATASVSEMRIIAAPAAYPVGSDIFVAKQAPGADCPNESRNHDLTVLKITGGSPPSKIRLGAARSLAAARPLLQRQMGTPIPLYGYSARRVTIAFTPSAATPAR